MKHVWYILSFILMVFVTGVLISFTLKQHEHALCEKINIMICNNTYHKFLEPNDIVQMLEQQGIKTKGELLKNINTLLIEKILQHNPAIREVIAYTTINGQLNIEVEQRVPIVRIIDKSLQQYFIDEEGIVLPDRIKQIAHVLVANGNIPDYNLKTGKSIFKTQKDTIYKKNILSDIFMVAKYIAANEFWKAQIEQIYVNEKRELILIPRVGNQVIIFGKAEEIEEKFIKLKSIYYAFNQIGWDKYKILNLKYKNQIVCIKR